jgi:uncharacterized protein YrrD
MIKGKEMIGRNIIALSSGTQIDKVHDLVFDHDANQVLALLVDEGGWFRAAKVVPFEAVRSIGEDAVMIDDDSHVVSARDDSRIADLLETKIGLIGTKLLTTDGRDLGKIADVYFDESSGKVMGYEATGGLFSDLSSGRTFVPAPETISIGENAAIVPVSVANQMEEQEAGGLQGALKSAGESISGAASSVGESVKSGYENLATATKERQKDYVVGKVAGSDVSSDEGLVIVTKGQAITEAQATLAETHGALGSLVAAATGGTMQAAYAGVAENVQSRAEDFSQASQDRQLEYVVGKTAGSTVTADDGSTIVRQGETISAVQAANASSHGALGSLVASATSGSVKDRIEDLSSASRERQIEYVLGKVAGSDVHGSDDSVIVLQGQIITPLAVQSAEEKGALGKLVASATAGSVQGGAQNIRQSVMGSPAPVSGSPESALGRRVRSDVIGPGRTLIAAQGQIVTMGVLERARALNREADLLRATGAGGEASGGGPALSDQLSAGLSNVSAGASGFLDRAKQWLGEKQGEASEAIDQRKDEMEAQKVRDALGRPVNRVILDPQDNIILNIGEIITNKAVNSARTAGILDILLSSVSSETVKINPLDVRPNETGKDALEGQGEVNIPKPQS